MSENPNATDRPTLAPRDWSAIERRIDAYIEEYELDDGESCYHVPTEAERFLLKDAIMGLFADDELLALLDRPGPSVQLPDGPRGLLEQAVGALEREVDAGWSPAARTELRRARTGLRMLALDAAAQLARRPVAEVTEVAQGDGFPSVRWLVRGAAQPAIGANLYVDE